MICKNCFNEYTGNFCPKCGAKAEAVPDTNVTEQNPYSNAYEEYEQNYSAYDYNQPEPQENTQYNPPQPPKVPMYQPQYYNYNPQIPKKSSGPKVLSIIALVLSACAFIISCASISNTDSESSYYDYDVIADDTENWVGEKVTSGNFEITATDSNTSDTYEGKKAKDGYEFLTVSFNVKNISDETDYFDCELNCYADKKYCKEVTTVSNDGYTYSKLPKGNTLEFDVVFEVPKDAISINVELTHYKYEWYNGEEIEDDAVHTFMIK